VGFLTVSLLILVFSHPKSSTS